MCVEEALPVGMPMPPYVDTAQHRGAMNRAFFAGVRHNVALGIEILDLGRDTAELLLRYAEFLVGDPETGALHSGPLCALLDAACGAAVFQALPAPAPIATLSLRVEHLRVAEAGHDVIASAHCHRVTRDVAFVRCEAFRRGDPAHRIALASGTFMVGTRRGRSESVDAAVAAWTAR